MRDDMIDDADIDRDEELAVDGAGTGGLSAEEVHEVYAAGEIPEGRWMLLDST